MRLLPVLFLVVSVAPVQAQLVQAQLLDPRTRDEDISGTRVTVDVSTTSEGLYLYTYGIVAPTTNKGSVARLRQRIEQAYPISRTFQDSCLARPTTTVIPQSTFPPTPVLHRFIRSQRTIGYCGAPITGPENPPWE
jgi:hypothetical protein